MKKILSILSVLVLVLTTFFAVDTKEASAAEPKLGKFTVERITSLTDDTPKYDPISAGEEFYVTAKWEIYPGQDELGGIDAIMWIDNTAVEAITSEGTGNGLANISMIIPSLINDDGEGYVSQNPGGKGTWQLAKFTFRAKRDITEVDNSIVTLGMRPYKAQNRYPGKYLWFIYPDYIARIGTMPVHWDGVDSEGKNALTLVRETKHKVTYVYESATAGKTLPTSIQAPTATEHAAGSDVTLPTVTSPVADADGVGQWVFKGWNPATVTNIQAPATVTGSWEYELLPVQKHTVTYEFVSGTTGKTLPADLVAPVATQHEAGTNVDITTTFANKEVVENGQKVGEWEFKGWNPATITAIAKDEKVVGTWEYTETSAPQPVKHTVGYTFEAKAGSPALPAEVTALIPALTQHDEGTDVTFTQTFADIKVTGGTWKFKGWDPVEIKAINAPAIVKGTWEYEADVVNPTVKHTVTYKYVATSGTLPADLVAPTATQHEAGSDVTLPTVKSPVKVTNGTWIFKGWDKEVKNIQGDVEVVGTWEFKLDTNGTTQPVDPGNNNPWPTAPTRPNDSDTDVDRPTTGDTGKSGKGTKKLAATGQTTTNAVALGLVALGLVAFLARKKQK